MNRNILWAQVGVKNLVSPSAGNHSRMAQRKFSGKLSISSCDQLHISRDLVPFHLDWGFRRTAIVVWIGMLMKQEFLFMSVPGV